MPTTHPQKRYIKRKLTPIQKKREMVLTILEVDKSELADAIGASRQVIHNVFSDRHRSLENEKKIVKFLNDKTQGLDDWEIGTLYALDVIPKGKSHITLSGFGWPAP